MARYTVSYVEFADRLTEVETLRKFALQKERLDAVGLRDEISALCRGSIVLLCSHVEAYIKELGELALDSLFTKGVPRTNISERVYYELSKDLLDRFEDTADPASKGKKIFEFLNNDLHYWSKTGPFPNPVETDRFNHGFASPGFKKISSYFNRFGYSGYKGDLKSKMAAQFTPTIAMVNHLVDMRNKIAHGNPSATKTPAEIDDMIRIIRQFCAASDSVFGTWWKNNYCSIR